jgi:hopanoid biosynthesis associated protein HpnK
LKKLIVNADDFGFTDGVNAGIVRAFQAGIVTSASIVANGGAFAEAVDRARVHPKLAVGCHLSLVGGRALTSPAEVPSLVDGNGQLPATVSELMGKLFRGAVTIEEIAHEFRAQLDRVVSSGIQPTHLDTHKHSHAHPRVMEAVSRVAADFGIRRVRNPFERFHYPKSPGPAARARRREHLKQYTQAIVLSLAAPRFRRLLKQRGLFAPDYFYGVGLTGLLDVEAIVALIRSLKRGVTELVCHPGIYDDQLEGAPTRLKKERERELEALTHPAVRRCVDEEGVALISYRELGV